MADSMEPARNEGREPGQPEGPVIRVLPNGPYRVTGVGIVRMRPVVDAEGDKVDWARGPELEHGSPVDLCRCGASSTKPFCDGSEGAARFDGTESADRGPSAGPAFRVGAGAIVLTEGPSLCARAAFCIARRFKAPVVPKTPLTDGPYNR